MKVEQKRASVDLVFGWRQVVTMICLCLTFALFSSSVSAQTDGRDEICVRVDKVGKAPGIWSGIVAATQSLDATVIASSTKEHKVGDRISFALYVVQGDAFSDRQTPQLNPKLIFVGARVTLGTGQSCRVAGSKEWIYTCIKRGCRKPVSVAAPTAPMH